MLINYVNKKFTAKSGTSKPEGKENHHLLKVIFSDTMTRKILIRGFSVYQNYLKQ